MDKYLEDFVGNTPLVRLKRLVAGEGNVVLAKLEGNNPAGSVKDRPALSMIRRAQERGDIKPGDTLIEPTSGNTGIALAMAATMMGYRMILVMPEHLSVERRQTMRAFGAEIVLTPKSGGMEMARDVAERMRDEGKGVILDQFGNPDNPLSHYEGTGPEIWREFRATSWKRKTIASRCVPPRNRRVTNPPARDGIPCSLETVPSTAPSGSTAHGSTILKTSRCRFRATSW